jgi:formyltetrahydrofolate deformylase
MSEPVRAVISVVGQDQTGVVARFATYLAEQGVNIHDIEQQVVHGQFIMDMLVDLRQMTLSFDALNTGLDKLGGQLGMTVRVNLHERREPKRVAALVSKEPHCLHQLIDDWQGGRLGGELACVLSNHSDLQPAAEAAGLPFEHHPAKDQKQQHFDWLLDRLEAYQIDLAVLARYMQILPSRVVQAFPQRIINIHPSLLPYFPGAKPYQQAWESGVRVSGSTAHYVTEHLDQGPIILQDVFHIDVGHDQPADVKERGKALEADVLAKAVRMHLDEKLVVVDDKVVFRPGLSRFLNHNGA